MLFNSLNFIVFFPVTIIVYYLIPKQYRHIGLLLSSWFFYGCFGFTCFLLLLGCTVVTYAGGRLIEGKNAESRKRILILCIVFCLCLLGVFKYCEFAIRNINAVLGMMRINVAVPMVSLMLPAGISFYTFKSMSYVIDVYNGKVSAEKNFLKYALFVSFFPQIIAGPIDRADNLLAQINVTSGFAEEDFRNGSLLMLWGYFEKLVIADRLGVLVDAVYDNYNTYSGAAITLATIMYGIQIYADFAGYSHIAIGASRILGYKVKDNFRQPYFALNIKDFWSRWHISMSTWFRDYLYIPLGGNRKGRFRKNVNNMLTFLASGLWHGSSWNFVVWGGIHGIYNVISDITAGFRDKAAGITHFDGQRVSGRLFKGIVTFILADYAWMYFRAGSLSEAFNMTLRILTDFRLYTVCGDWIYDLGLSEMQVRSLIPAIFVLFVVDMVHEKNISIIDWLKKQGVVFRFSCYIFSILLIMLTAVQNLGRSSAGFIYFRF